MGYSPGGYKESCTIEQLTLSFSFQWLGLRVFTARGLGSIPGQDCMLCRKIKKKKKKEKEAG